MNSYLSTLLTRAIAAELSGNWSDAGFEREVEQETTRAVGKSASGFYVPQAVLGRAVITTATAPALIGTDHMSSAFIDALRPEVAVMDLGATVLPGLVENVAIPRMVSGTAAEWIGEDAAASESSPVFDSVPLTLKQLSARSQLSRRQLKQSLPGLDVLLKNDLRRSIGIELDRAAISGAGSATVPRGILNTAGNWSVAIGANGGSPNFPFLTRLMAEVEAENVAGTSYGWLTNHFVKGIRGVLPRLKSMKRRTLSERLPGWPWPLPSTQASGGAIWCNLASNKFGMNG